MTYNTLRNTLPYDGNIYDTDPAFKYLDINVIHVFDGYATRWPGKHKNVTAWYLLANKRIVAWNENLNTGWSFPMMKAPNSIWEKYGKKE